jgi:hypothetical protein
MPRKTRSALQEAEAAYAALSNLDKAAFCYNRILEKDSLCHQMMLAILGHYWKVVEPLEDEIRRLKRKPDAEKPYEILELKKKLSWTQLAKRLGISVEATRKRHDRAEKRLARESQPYMFVS